MDEYWQRTVSLDSAFLDGDKRERLIKVHEEEERYYRLNEIMPIKRQSGTRTYFHARAFYPYAAPILRMAIAPPPSMDTLGPEPKHQGSIGTILHSEVMLVVRRFC